EAATKAAQQFWKEWSSAHKYHLLASRDGRVLLLVPEHRSRSEHALELVERSLARFDEILPTPPAPPPAPADAASQGADANVPPLSPDQEIVWTWGSPDNPLDADPIVLGVFQNPADYASALGVVGAAFPYLASWIEHGKNDPGCILERPLFGACVENAPG